MSSPEHGHLLTPRLRLEPWNETHTEMLVRLAAMPAVTRHIGDGAPWGYAREGALAVRDEAFLTVQAPRVVAPHPAGQRGLAGGGARARPDARIRRRRACRRADRDPAVDRPGLATEIAPAHNRSMPRLLSTATVDRLTYRLE